MAEPPRAVKRTKRLSLEQWRNTPKSIRLSAYLFILGDVEKRELSEYQRFWIANFQSKLSFAELNRGYQQYRLWITHPELLRRQYALIAEAHRRIPLGGPPLAEKRRIGIGYRDKGSLRPHHQRRTVGLEVLWSEDCFDLFGNLLPEWCVKEPGWITAREVKSHVGDTLLELLSPRRGQELAKLIPVKQLQHEPET